MGIRDLIAYAADQYGVDRGLLDSVARLESGYQPHVQNNWDSNAKAGIPSYGLMQFVKPTFDGFAKQAAAANPNAWARYNGQYNYRDPRQQALAAAWGIANGKGSHWSTYGRAQQAASQYTYKPKYTSQPGTGTPTVVSTSKPAYTPQQLANVSREYDNQIKLGRSAQQEAAATVGRYNTANTEVLDRKAIPTYTLDGMDMASRSAMLRQPTQARTDFDSNKAIAQSLLNESNANLARMQGEKNSTLARMKQQRIVTEAMGTAMASGWNGQGNPFRFLEKKFGLGRSSSDHDAPGVHEGGSFHYRPAEWGGVQGYDYGDARNDPKKLTQLANYIKQNYQSLGINEFFYDPLGWYIDQGKVVSGSIGGHDDHVHMAIDRILGKGRR